MSPAPLMRHRGGGNAAQRCGAVGEARGQHGQQRPADGETEQEPAGDHGFPAARERAGDERERGDEPAEERDADDHRGLPSVVFAWVTGAVTAAATMGLRRRRVGMGSTLLATVGRDIRARP